LAKRPVSRARLERLFEEHSEWAAKIARNVARRVPPTIPAEDLIQEAHKELWRQVGLWDVDRGVPFRGFAFRAVLGAVRMACRRRRWTEATRFDSLSAPDREPGPAWLDSPAALHTRADLLPDTRETVEAEMIAGEERARHLAIVRGHLAQLADVEARLVRCVYLEGIDLDELAEAWGMEAKRIGVRARCALSKLKRLVSG
jgi:RNA polymerase sigma factor (sigma-70 family)